MKAIDVIRNALTMADLMMMSLIEDLKDVPFAQPTPRGGNHAMWILGHITLIEGNVPKILSGEPNPVEHWGKLFAPGSQPLTDASAYPAFDEVVSTYRNLRARNLQILEQLGDEGLDQPTQSPPPDLKDAMRTAGELFHLIAMHQITHRGQLAVIRRALGRKTLFTPGRRDLDM